MINYFSDNTIDPAEGGKSIYVKVSNGELLEVPYNVLVQSRVLLERSEILEQCGVIDLPDIEAFTMKLVIRFMLFFVDDPPYIPYEPGYYPVANFDRDITGRFIMSLDPTTLSKFWIAGDYLQMDRLTDDVYRSLYYRVSLHLGNAENTSTVSNSNFVPK